MERLVNNEAGILLDMEVAKALTYVTIKQLGSPHLQVLIPGNAIINIPTFSAPAPADCRPAPGSPPGPQRGELERSARVPAIRITALPEYSCVWGTRESCGYFEVLELSRLLMLLWCRLKGTTGN